MIVTIARWRLRRRLRMLERQIDRRFDPVLSRRIDALVVALEKLR